MPQDAPPNGGKAPAGNANGIREVRAMGQFVGGRGEAANNTVRYHTEIGHVTAVTRDYPQTAR